MTKRQKNGRPGATGQPHKAPTRTAVRSDIPRLARRHACSGGPRPWEVTIIKEGQKLTACHSRLTGRLDQAERALLAAEPASRPKGTDR